MPRGRTMISRRGLCLSALAMAGGCRSWQSGPTREIAITFDDAPKSGSAMMSGEERTRRLIAALADAGIAEAAFFATPRRLTQEGRARLRAYGAAGHIIGNHSATHVDLRRVSAAAFLADVARADRQLRTFPGFRPWFRFPFLAEGKTQVKRDAVRQGLQRMGYAQGYVTVDTYDWYLDRTANRAVERGEHLDLSGLRDLYVETLVRGADFYDRIAVSVLGRSPRHVLLLHENDLATLFVGDLVAALRRAGWTTITITSAYADPIAQILPKTLFANQGRVAALAHDAGMKRRQLVSPQEEETLLDRQFQARVLHVGE